MFHCSTGNIPVRSFEWLVEGKPICGNEVANSTNTKHSTLTLTKRHCLPQERCKIECHVTSNKGTGYWYSTAELVLSKLRIEFLFILMKSSRVYIYILHARKPLTSVGLIEKKKQINALLGGRSYGVHFSYLGYCYIPYSRLVGVKKEKN